MSGIAELLANLGYEVSGSDAKTLRTSPIGWRRSASGSNAGTTPAHVGDADVVVVSSAIQPGNPEVAEARRASHSGDPAGRDARRADAAALRHRHRRRARQDDDDVDGGAGARARRPRSDGGHRRPAERLRQQRAARARRLHGRRGGRKRSIVPEADAVDRGDYEHRPRAHGELRQLGRPAAGVRRLREQGAVLRRGRRVRRRRTGPRAGAADDAPGHHLRPRGRAARTCTGARHRARGVRLALPRGPRRRRRQVERARLDLACACPAVTTC